ncbi:MAG: penicillin-binding protein 2 [Candidatus Magasanikbacteria bacterium]|mgnify:CR=1 FL=1|jgi:penicillin-binding protein 2|nr:penicillin-binding protein 2 [Candidatus Magasanikbacteria bacterium]MBT4221319.1 penicillin-binding protein 2 [Candidatus Magasanikbacteria bacterium]MBT4350833.1 penicillin-binding protein 2 [Candidatus Magasanikbacteria bacterium]MBT4542167.1 penicillin-binding protein 2 [Candidatus Magasanikbacteria bacterium]MBT6253443.1 penicillin-binding protein 2 [Candidatus Magasanikbacteria bacterium]
MNDKKDDNKFFAFGDIKFPKIRLKNRQKKSWTEDSFVFEVDTGKQIATPNAGRYIGSSFSSKRVKQFSTAIIIIFALISGRVIQLQVVKGAEYKNIADRNSQRYIPIPAERGLIYDRNGIQLTKNVPNFSLALIPQDLPRERRGEKNEAREQVISTLANLVEADQESIRNTLREYGAYSYESIVIEEDIDYETALSIEIASADLPGINIKRGSKRLYLTTTSTGDIDTTSLSHILGYQGKLNKEELDRLYTKGYLPSDSIGKSGIEKEYESNVRGTYGTKQIEVNALGKEQAVLSEEAPIPGNHLYLTIDANMQEALEQIMHKKLKKYKKTRAVGIVTNVRNGEILAMVSLPTFDNNDFSGGIDYKTYDNYITNEDRPLFNRAISGGYPSGSSIKPIMAAIALEEGIITKNTSILSTGGVSIGASFFPDWLNGGHGPTNVRRSLAQSINTFYYYIGGGYKNFVGLGVDKMNEHLRLFGFAEQLGIDIPGEIAGFIPTKEWKKEKKGEPWYIGDTYNLSIGQGFFLTSPLQIANITASIANGGTVYTPHIGRQTLNPITKEITPIEKEPIAKNIINIAHLDTVKLGMRDCVTYGSCKILSNLPFSTGAKTGTAQWNKNKDHHAWFTSFAPFTNPEISVTVLIEEGGEGGIVSAPIAYEFYKWWWSYTNT